MTRYPHTLSYLRTTSESSQDSNGNWNASVPSVWVVIGECRVSPNGSGRHITLTDGSATVFSSSIVTPVLPEEIQFGTEIKVVDENGIEKFAGKVLRFSNDRKNATLWA
jgi:hypothetical protein